MARKISDSGAAGADADPAVATGLGALPASDQPYIVLARKYRPQTFDDLIGQEALVRTLRNAFAADRIAQGYMLTGVRGVGKTTTARILARALNYAKPGLPDRPTTGMPDFGVHCREIMESRHPDVLEMDAASNTGVDNMRELIESARYAPLSARFKVYVIDEVHMLSKGAFNALLKTLEEPPPHVKFIFATTEVRKVPVTVLSRCQRFDLRRVDVASLTAHFARIVGSEGWRADDDALLLIARAAEGSVRDGLSMLDQAAAIGSGKIDAAGVRAMLGLADRSRIFDLLEHVFRGAAGPALDAMSELHRDGADPVQVLSELAEGVHIAARTKAAGAAAGADVLPAEERRRAGLLAERLSVAVLSRAWQMLLKGLEDAGKAPDPAAAAEMVLIRIAHMADLPSPEDVLRQLGGVKPPPRPQKEETRSDAAVPAGADAPSNEQVAVPHADPFNADDPDEDQDVLPMTETASAQPRSFQEIVELAGLHRDARLKVHLEEHVSLVRFDPSGSIELALLAGAPREIANELRENLNAWTGRRWIVAVSTTPGAPSLAEERRRRQAADVEAAARDPLVKAVLEQFPDAKIADIAHARRRRDDDKAAG